MENKKAKANTKIEYTKREIKGTVMQIEKPLLNDRLLV